MKKLLSLLFIMLIAFGGYILYDNYLTSKIPKLTIEESAVNVDKMFIYGTHFNLSGSLVDDTDLDLVLYNGDFYDYVINNKINSFNLSDNVNEGINLENIPLGKYYVFLRGHSKDDNDKDIYRYYALKNDTIYPSMTYYTFSNVGNKIIIRSDDEYKTLFFQVTKNDKIDVFDVVIDPGHGGLDSGASYNGNKESEYTLKIAEALKDSLEEKGIKVKLTHSDGQLSSKDKLPDYGKNSRTAIGHESNSKYLLSIHLNSSSSTKVKGLEIYTPQNINYDFAKELAGNIVDKTKCSYSTNTINRIMNGVYTRTFTEADIESSIDEAKKLGRTAYDITTNSNYYFIIRENGGIITGAYVDGRNSPKIPANIYYNSNIGVETYLLELGYLTNSNDLDNIKNNQKKYVEAISNTFYNLFSGSMNK